MIEVGDYEIEQVLSYGEGTRLNIRFYRLTKDVFEYYIFRQQKLGHIVRTEHKDTWSIHPLESNHVVSLADLERVFYDKVVAEEVLKSGDTKYVYLVHQNKQVWSVVYDGEDIVAEELEGTYYLKGDGSYMYDFQDFRSEEDIAQYVLLHGS